MGCRGAAVCGGKDAFHLDRMYSVVVNLTWRCSFNHFVNVDLQRIVSANNTVTAGTQGIFDNACGLLGCCVAPQQVHVTVVSFLHFWLLGWWGRVICIF